ncbi:DUF3857 domain-containing protein [Algoriphagus sp. CAU 1675]|uniref:DUF3857 domain-containing protein n=1 Tax=Algoriphagus sp. CAU 1675 TaxID=3032597 RepID=UPI0023DC5C67|nr:DUF3857 domain-containing protein [Algoriphagus sp. CAU 1675]MDF2156539.1 transglutaminase domain-containing protein [Algoriphagus sp. CAU 1675]
MLFPRILISLLLLGFPMYVQAQVEFGKYSEEELALEVVPFEPDAKVVTLWEEGNSYFMVTGLHTDFHHRLKILDDNLLEFGDIVINFYRGKTLVEDIVKINAQVSYLENGERKVEKLSKNNIKEINLGGGEFEYRLIFPHVKKGSILEYSYKKIDHQYGILEGWAFQKEIPALYSKYTFKSPSYFIYQMIMQGDRLPEVSDIHEKKRLYSWTLKDVPSLPNEPFVGNLLDYQDRVDGYLFTNEYINPEKIEESEAFYASWNHVANSWMKFDDVKPYYLGPSPEVRNYPKLEFEENTQLAKAKKIYDYVAKNYRASYSSRYLEPIYPLDEFLEEKKGNSFDKNLLMLNLLKEQGIDSKIVMVNERKIGRTKLIEVPFINQFHSSILSATIDGKEIYLDATDSITPFGLLPVSKLVKRAFFIEKDNGRLEDLNHKHRSGSIFFTSLEKDSLNKPFFKHQVRLTDYNALQAATLLRALKEVEEYLVTEKNIEKESISNVSVNDQLSSNRTLTISFNSEVNTENPEQLVLNPFEFSSFRQNPFTQESRILPIEFDFPFYENMNVSIPFPEGYQLDDYPESQSLTIPSKKVRFSYLTDIRENEIKLNCKIEFLEDYYSVKEYPDMKYLMENVAALLSTPLIFTKTSNP